MLELSEVITSADFARTARHPAFPQAFTRCRKLPLPGLIAALLCQRGQSQQVTLDSFFASLCDNAVPLRGISDRAFAKDLEQWGAQAHYFIILPQSEFMGKGKAPKNLEVPEYSFISDTVVKIG